MAKEIKTLTALEATKIVKSLGINILSRKLTPAKMKVSNKQAFCDIFAGVNYVYYIFDLDEKTVRQGNIFEINGQLRFRYYKEPAKLYSI